MHVRPLTPSDLDSYRTLMLEAYAMASDAFTSTRDERAALPDAWWRKRLGEANDLAATFGAFDNERLIGTVTMEYADRTKTRHKAHLVGMYVVPDARGVGAGRALVLAALDHARGRTGVVVVTLTHSLGNAAAAALYAACGFVAFGVEPMAIREGSRYIDKVHMQCMLCGTQSAVSP